MRLLALLAPCWVRDLEISSVEEEAESGPVCSAWPEVAVTRFLRAFSQSVLSWGSSFNSCLSYVENVVVCFSNTLR
jgi:hypothetical protein